jgi:cytochrome P450
MMTMLQRVQQGRPDHDCATLPRGQAGGDTARPPGPRGGNAVRTLARFAAGRPLEAAASLFARYGDTVYLPVRPWEGLYLFSRPEQAEHVLAASQDNYVKPFTYRPLRLMLGDGLVTAEDPLWRRHQRIIQPVFSSRNVASFAAEMDAGAQLAAARWNGSQHVELATEMSALTLDIVGRVLFSADLTAEAPPLRRALAGEQWLGCWPRACPSPRRRHPPGWSGARRGCSEPGVSSSRWNS